MSSCEAWEMPGEMIPGWDPEIAKMMNFDSRMKKKEIMGRGRGHIDAKHTLDPNEIAPGMGKS